MYLQPDLPAVHRVHEVHIAEHIVLERSDGGECGTSKVICPPSLGGGCCPEGYASAAAAAAASTTSIACGVVGYYDCPAAADYGSCCPIGLICEESGDSCLAPEYETVTKEAEGVTTTILAMVPVQHQLHSMGGIIDNTPLAGEEIGGIVGGAVAFLLVIGLTVWFVTRRLNKVVALIKARLDQSTAEQGPPAAAAISQESLEIRKVEYDDSGSSRVGGYHQYSAGDGGGERACHGEERRNERAGGTKGWSDGHVGSD
ncbi:hypothetical protein F4778DRAFT_670721 [Xylariomycetidae sp. FL2044]|nr:hypothetical protein F4778DRAFT_670721 [Xylariomycetidae sp. FL2044]